MFDAFSKDKSGFKASIFLLFLVSCVFLFSSFIVLNLFNTTLAENEKLGAEYRSQAEWFKSFDKDGALRLQRQLVKPCKANELDSVQQRQLEVLASHGVRINSVRKSGNDASAKGSAKALKMSVDFSGSWSDVRAALNSFEKQDSLVVITKLNLKSDSTVTCNMDYFIYYM